MKINFDWKYSLIEMPKKDEKIFVYVLDINSYSRYFNTILMGKFHGLKGNGYYSFVGREMVVNTVIRFGNSLSYNLPFSGFYWDYVKPNFNIPSIKEIRKNKINQINLNEKV